MKSFILTLSVGLVLLTSTALQADEYPEVRRISVEDYRNKMAGGWLGQMVGVGWGAPTEFRYKGEIIPEENVPVWTPDRINQYNQDDIYVEMTFLRSMELYGFDVSIRQAGIDFANSGYRLWHANKFGRENLRNGIAPPDSGHPEFNAHADDIDYQIEADYSGLIAPGMPNMGIALGEKFGRLMNYGDGLYGGQFVAGMYAEAFFEDDPRTVVEAGLACVPAESQFAETIRDVLKWTEEHPEDWQAVWELIEAKYQDNPDYRRFSCSDGDFNIDAKINAAYIIMGLLYGESDIAKTTVISMRCGQDSDCNPSNATGILCTILGADGMSDEYVSALDRTPKYSHTEYNFDTLLDVCEDLARQAVEEQGGRIEKDATGAEYFVIPVVPPVPTALEQCWAPGPSSGSRFTEEEMEQIITPEEAPTPSVDISAAVGKVAPGWSIRDCGSEVNPGFRTNWGGRENVLITHPLTREKPCVLYREVQLVAGTSFLVIETANDPRGDWTLVVKANGEQLARQDVTNIDDGFAWRTIEVDLSSLADEEVLIEIENRANGWQFESGSFSKIAIETR
jgi:hypothetical protein